jgi:hypothetical protein
VPKLIAAGLSNGEIAARRGHAARLQALVEPLGCAQPSFGHASVATRFEPFG